MPETDPMTVNERRRLIHKLWGALVQISGIKTQPLGQMKMLPGKGCQKRIQCQLMNAAGLLTSCRGALAHRKFY